MQSRKNIETGILESNLDFSRDFDRIYILYFSRVYRFAQEYIVSEEDAENVVQDIFAMLWENRSSINIKYSLTSYLFNITKNQCLNFLHHKSIVEKYKKEQALKLSALELLNDTFSSETDIDNLVHQAIDKLPERCREIFIRNRFQGKKYREIAVELDLSESTVATQISIALKRMRDSLKDYLPLLLFLLEC